MEEIVEDVYVVEGHSLGDMNCCIYMVDTRSDNGLVLIDAGLYIEPIQSIDKEGFDVKHIQHCLITHGHLDHFGVCSELKKLNKDVRFYAHELDAEKISDVLKTYVKLNENLRKVAEVNPSDTKALLDLTLAAYQLEFV